MNRGRVELEGTNICWQSPRILIQRRRNGEIEYFADRKSR